VASSVLEKANLDTSQPYCPRGLVVVSIGVEDWNAELNNSLSLSFLVTQIDYFNLSPIPAAQASYDLRQRHNVASWMQMPQE
jgi:hypothetical protein